MKGDKWKEEGVADKREMGKREGRKDKVATYKREAGGSFRQRRRRRRRSRGRTGAW